jgi:hypothetical protein
MSSARVPAQDVLSLAAAKAPLLDPLHRSVVRCVRSDCDAPAAMWSNPVRRWAESAQGDLTPANNERRTTVRVRC